MGTERTTADAVSGHNYYARDVTRVMEAQPNIPRPHKNKIQQYKLHAMSIIVNKPTASANPCTVDPEKGDGDPFSCSSNDAETSASPATHAAIVDIPVESSYSMDEQQKSPDQIVKSQRNICRTYTMMVFFILFLPIIICLVVYYAIVTSNPN